MIEVGNEISNKFWQHRLPEDDQISPESSRCVHVLHVFLSHAWQHFDKLFSDSRNYRT